MGWPLLIVGEASLSLLFVMPPRIAESHVPTGWLILGLSGQPFFSSAFINMTNSYRLLLNQKGRG